ncbi:MAG: hypothetical protein FWC64_09785 [Treponema sp.]|nr:hypothetical protein [Treponema sp.]
MDKYERVRKINKHYDPVKAIRYHFTEFYIWAGFFIAINGGLFTAYFNINFKTDSTTEIIISLLGCIASLLFFWNSRAYHLCFFHLSELIQADFDSSHYHEFSHLLKFAKMSTARIALAISAILTVTWTGLVIASIYECVQNVQADIISLILIYILIALICVLIIVCICLGCCFKKSCKSKK